MPWSRSKRWPTSVDASGVWWGRLVAMIGFLIIFAVLLVVIPVGFLMTMAIPAGIIGTLLTKGSEADNEGSELIETNR